MRSFSFSRFRQSRGRTAVFVALTLGAAVAAAFVVPAVANGRVNPHLTVLGQTQFVDNTTGDAYAVQGVVGGQSNASAVEGFVTNASAMFDNAIFGYTVAPSGNAIIGIAQPASSTATALVGYSYRGDGVIGQTPYAGATVDGVLGQDLSGGSLSNSGVMGTTTSGFGVSGTASGASGWGGDFSGSGSGGLGIFATSSQSIGAEVESFTSDGVLSYSFRDSTSGGGIGGVYGFDEPSPTTAINDSGVIGQSSYGFGITGQSGLSGGTINAGTGISGVTYNDSNSNPNTVNGVQGIDNDPCGCSFDAGVFGSTINGYGVRASSSSYIGTYSASTSYIGVFASSASTVSPALEANDTAATASSSPLFIAHSGLGGGGGQDVFSFAADGTVIATGNIVAFGSPLLRVHTTSGTDEIAYGARQSRPTIEDVGEGTLINGNAFVAIDRSFGSTIDPDSSYLVFITPQGDTNGLYVTGKTHAGFYVREHNGASNIAFDYRIVAKPAFDNGTRLPDVRSFPVLAKALYTRSAQSPKENQAVLAAKDRVILAHSRMASVSAAQVAAQQRTQAMNAAREAQVRKMKVPHVPTPAELHVPATFTHN